MKLTGKAKENFEEWLCNFPNVTKEKFWNLNSTFQQEIYEKYLGSIAKCKHENIKREDGLDECLDCGVRNY